MLIDLIRGDCNVNEIRKFIENQPHVVNEPSDERFPQYPLHIAIRQKCSLEVLKQLLKHGADVNTEGTTGLPLETYFRYGNYNTSTNCDTVELLLEYGADVNLVPKLGLPPPFVNFVRESSLDVYDRVYESGILVETLKIMLPHATESTVTSTIDRFIEDVIKSHWREKETERFVVVLKSLMEIGTPPNTDRIRNYFWWALKQSLDERSKDFSKLFRIFEFILPHCLIHSRSSRLENKTFDFDLAIRVFQYNYPKCDLPTVETIARSLESLWTNCVTEYDRSRNDIVWNDISVLDVLRNSQRIKPENSYALLVRLGRYPYFERVMRDAIENGDLTKLYVLISQNHSGTSRVLNPDCLETVKKFLTKRDFVNYLLSLL